jgi:hypothetical protein
MLLFPDTPDADVLDSHGLSTQAPAPAIELEQPISQERSGEMLELPWCSFDQEFRGYAEADWWSTRNTAEYALSFG